MAKEYPSSEGYIDHLVSTGQARHFMGETDGTETDENDWIYTLLDWLHLDDRQTILFEAIGAGHTIADASRMAGESPSWGRDTLRNIRNRVSPTELPNE